MDILSEVAPWPIGASLTHGCGTSIVISFDDLQNDVVHLTDGFASGTCPVCGLPFTIQDPATMAIGSLSSQ